MTNYNERLDEVLLHTGIGNCGDPFCDKPNIGVDEAKQAINSLNKELVAESKPARGAMGGEIQRIRNGGRNLAIDEFEQNLLKALEEV